MIQIDLLLLLLINWFIINCY